MGVQRASEYNFSRVGSATREDHWRSPLSKPAPSFAFRAAGSLVGLAAGRAGLAGVLLGARDGARSIPASWTVQLDSDILGDLATRLVRVDQAAASRAHPTERDEGGMN